MPRDLDESAIIILDPYLPISATGIFLEEFMHRVTAAAHDQPSDDLADHGVEIGLAESQELHTIQMEQQAQYHTHGGGEQHHPPALDPGPEQALSRPGRPGT